MQQQQQQQQQSTDALDHSYYNDVRKTGQRESYASGHIAAHHPENQANKETRANEQRSEYKSEQSHQYAGMNGVHSLYDYTYAAASENPGQEQDYDDNHPRSNVTKNPFEYTGMNGVNTRPSYNSAGLHDDPIDDKQNDDVHPPGSELTKEPVQYSEVQSVHTREYCTSPAPIDEQFGEQQPYEVYYSRSDLTKERDERHSPTNYNGSETTWSATANQHAIELSDGSCCVPLWLFESLLQQVQKMSEQPQIKNMHHDHEEVQSVARSQSTSLRDLEEEIARLRQELQSKSEQLEQSYASQTHLQVCSFSMHEYTCKRCPLTHVYTHFVWNPGSCEQRKN